MEVQKTVKKYLVLLVLVLIGFLSWGIFLPVSSIGKEQIFSVEKGQGSFKIAENLEKEGLISSKLFFSFYIFLAGDQKRLQAGKYFISPSESIAKIANKIISGDTAKITITIPEGWTQKQIEEALNLKLPGDNLEGYLFPDTYHLPFGATGEEVVKIMKDNFEKKTADLKITNDIVVMASLIEKEVRTQEDKELVSGLLWKRLRVGMPLQVDVEMWTYKNRGLPPAPIANPGLESILAALNPKASPYWYYLSAKEGQTIFSRTLEEHNLARAKYLK
ncbi:MAG: endolytic transglycosylase MltG [Patescibacteria group bacterium]